MTSFTQWIKRLDDLKRRAVLKRRGRVPIIDTTAWSADDQIAYRDGTSAERDALIARLFGDVPDPIEPGDITAIIVMAPLGPPEDDDTDV